MRIISLLLLIPLRALIPRPIYSSTAKTLVHMQEAEVKIEKEHIEAAFNNIKTILNDKMKFILHQVAWNSFFV